MNKIFLKWTKPISQNDMPIYEFLIILYMLWPVFGSQTGGSSNPVTISSKDSFGLRNNTD
jgi:hypothetical protein